MIRLLILNNFYPVISYRRVQKKKKAVNNCTRFGHSLWCANQLPAQEIKLGKMEKNVWNKYWNKHYARNSRVNKILINTLFAKVKYSPFLVLQISKLFSNWKYEVVRFAFNDTYSFHSKWPIKTQEPISLPFLV